MNKPHYLLLAALVVMAISPGVQAGVVHAYNFSADAPLADDVGGAELIAVGDVVLSPEGFATFDGKGGHLVTEAIHPLGQVYTVSFWVRSDDYQPSEEDVAVGVLASTDKNPFVKGNWSVSLRRNILRFGGKTLDNASSSQSLIEKPEPGLWHLVTLKFNSTDGGGLWVNEDPFVPFAALNAKEGDPLPAYEDIRILIIGSDLQGKAGFSGDIADVRISDDVDWDDAKQAAAYQAGPALGTAAIAAPAKN